MKNDRLIRRCVQRRRYSGRQRHQLGIGDVLAGVFIGIANID
jgi:hypothetical protein